MRNRGMCVVMLAVVVLLVVGCGKKE